MAWLMAASPSARATMATWLAALALLQDQPAQALPVVVEELGRAHGAGDEDRVLRQIAGRCRADPAGEEPQQAVGQVVDVVQALARIRIGLAEHAGARIVAHALHRGFGGEAGEQRLLEPPAPAAVMGEHAEGFQHLAMLAGALEIAALEHAVDHAGQLLDRLRQPAALELDVLGDQLGDDDARLVQHHVAERHALRDRLTPVEGGRSARGGSPPARLRR